MEVKVEHDGVGIAIWAAASKRGRTKLSASSNVQRNLAIRFFPCIFCNLPAAGMPL